MISALRGKSERQDRPEAWEKRHDSEEGEISQAPDGWRDESVARVDDRLPVEEGGEEGDADEDGGKGLSILPPDGAGLSESEDEEDDGRELEGEADEVKLGFASDPLAVDKQRLDVGLEGSGKDDRA